MGPKSLSKFCGLSRWTYPSIFGRKHYKSIPIKKSPARTYTINKKSNEKTQSKNARKKQPPAITMYVYKDRERENVIVIKYIHTSITYLLTYFKKKSLSLFIIYVVQKSLSLHTYIFRCVL